MTYSEPRSIYFVLFKIRIPAAHSAFIFSHHSLGLTLLPICPSMTYHVGLADSELTLSPPAVLTDWVPSLSTPSACRSLSMPFRFDTRTGLRPGCCTSSVISTNDFAYLPGLHTARPSAFVEGAGFEPAMSQISRCHLAVGYSSLPSSSRPTFQIYLS